MAQWNNVTEENTGKTDNYGDLCCHTADVWIQKWRRTCVLLLHLVCPRVTLNSAPFASRAVAARLEDSLISWFLFSSGHRRAQYNIYFLSLCVCFCIFIQLVKLQISTFSWTGLHAAVYMVQNVGLKRKEPVQSGEPLIYSTATPSE